MLEHFGNHILSPNYVGRWKATDLTTSFALDLFKTLRQIVKIKPFLSKVLCCMISFHRCERSHNSENIFRLFGTARKNVVLNVKLRCLKISCWLWQRTCLIERDAVHCVNLQRTRRKGSWEMWGILNPNKYFSGNLWKSELKQILVVGAFQNMSILN